MRAISSSVGPSMAILRKSEYSLPGMARPHGGRLYV